MISEMDLHIGNTYWFNCKYKDRCMKVTCKGTLSAINNTEDGLYCTFTNVEIYEPSGKDNLDYKFYDFYEVTSVLYDDVFDTAEQAFTQSKEEYDDMHNKFEQELYETSIINAFHDAHIRNSYGYITISAKMLGNSNMFTLIDELFIERYEFKQLLDHLSEALNKRIYISGDNFYNYALFAIEPIDNHKIHLQGSKIYDTITEYFNMGYRIYVSYSDYKKEERFK
jgi:hypothetical protein